MSFTDEQVRRLRARVRARNVKAREMEGKTLHYLEGWHVVSEANRIFGFDAWDRETVSSECVWRTQIDQQFAAAYLTRVRIRVRAGDGVVVREGLGSGEAIAPTPGQAHERASKAAETDATKRALSTFGNSFGLSLYRDKTEAPKPARPSVEQIGAAARRVVRAVSRRMREGAGETSQMSLPGWSAREEDGHARGGKAAEPPAAEEPAKAASQSEAGTSPHPFIREPRQEEAARTETSASPLDAPAVLEEGEAPGTEKPDARAVVMMPVHLPPRARIDKSVLTLSEPKRRRDREHLRFIARQPCLVCARTPSQAHHLRIAQPRALGRKVSDEFTVPLCALHHHDLHMNGNETEWWWGRNIDPMPIAERLWLTRRLAGTRDEPAAE